MEAQAVDFASLAVEVEPALHELVAHRELGDGGESMRLKLKCCRA